MKTNYGTVYANAHRAFNNARPHERTEIFESELEAIVLSVIHDIDQSEELNAAKAMLEYRKNEVALRLYEEWFNEAFAQACSNGLFDAWGKPLNLNRLNAAHELAGQPVHSDDIHVDIFAAAMKAKLLEARMKGRGGWDSPDVSANRLSMMLRNHVEKGDPRDVANFCMFLYQRGERIERDPVHGMSVHALAGEIVKAFVTDQANEGSDISAGMFGTEFSALIRRLAKVEIDSGYREELVRLLNEISKMFTNEPDLAALLDGYREPMADEARGFALLLGDKT